MRNWPDPSVIAVRLFSMSAGLAASTVTPGKTAPDVSRTMPAIDACAKSEWGATRTLPNTATIAASRRIESLLLTRPDLDDQRDTRREPALPWAVRRNYTLRGASRLSGNKRRRR